MNNTLIIDTREKFEYSASHVKGSINIPPAEFMKNDLPKELANVAKDSQIVVYCRTGSRSNVVGHILRSRGFTNVVNGINQQHVERMLSQ